MIKEDIIKYLDELYPNPKCALLFNNNYELLIAIILSAQTTDIKVNKVDEILFKKYPDIASLADAKFDDVYEIIRPLGLATNKTKNIIKAAIMIRDKYLGNIPDKKELLLEIPGVGVKVAEVYLGILGSKEYFPVDTHVFRVSHKLGLSKSKDVIKTSNDLKKYFKGYDYMHIHHQMIWFGRDICKAISPKCDICKLKCKMRSQ